MGEQSEPSIGLDDLGDNWRIDIERVWTGAAMTPSFSAHALTRTNGRWKRVGKRVVNDKGPIQAAGDLLAALELGLLR